MPFISHAFRQGSTSRTSFEIEFAFVPSLIAARLAAQFEPTPHSGNPSRSNADKGRASALTRPPRKNSLLPLVVLQNLFADGFLFTFFSANSHAGSQHFKGAQSIGQVAY